jgi:PAS domain S-box-containing protein
MKLPRRTGMVGLESGVKLFVPLLVVFLVLADIGLYYVFSRLEDTVMDGFDRGLLAASRMVDSRLELPSLKAFVDGRRGPEYARGLRTTLMTAAVEGRLLGAMVVDQHQEVLIDSRTADPGGAVLSGEAGAIDLDDVWSGEEVFVTVRSDDGLWTRYVFTPLSVSGQVFAALAVGSDFSLHYRLLRATNAYLLVRLVFLVFLVGAVLLFVVSVLRPFQKLKRTALVVRSESGDEEDSEFIISTFQKVVADLREKEAELKELLAEQRTRAESLEEYNEYILSNMSGGLVCADMKGMVTTFNRAAGEILGIRPAAALKIAYSRVLTEPVLADMVKDTLERGETRRGLEMALHSEKGEVWLSVSSSLLKSDDGDVVGAALLLTDITELKRLQENMLLREKLASLGEMSAGIAHQFRNSLGSIIGYATLLKKKHDSISTIDKILKESKILNDMVESFLNFARPVKLQLSSVDPRALVGEVLDATSDDMEKNGISVSSSLKHGRVNIAGDPLLLKQALVNVFRNSMDAMQSGGSLKVESGANPRAVILKITDTGRGIPADQVSHIFTPFFSLTEGGVGLGLPIAHRIITSHDGTIEVESQLGVGTTITISLPIADRADE